MAKSKIIKDLANSTAELSTALKRAKVIFSSLGDEVLKHWVNEELTGYKEDDRIPTYRIAKGIVQATYVQMVMPGRTMKFTNTPFPLNNMPEDLRNTITTVKFRDSVDGLKSLTKAKGQLGVMLSPDIFPYLIQYNGNLTTTIASAETIVEKQFIENILATIENKLMESLLLLEEEFGNLDELDIDTSTKTTQQLEDIANKIIIIIYNDQSVTIGNNNRIKNTQIGK